MIDHLDTQTTSLPLEKKAGRGRPKSGNALTPAQKQKAYRERKRGNVAVNEVQHLDENMKLRAELLAAMEEIEGLKSKLRAEFELGEKARKQVVQLMKQEKSNVTGKGNGHSSVPEGGVWTVRFKLKGSRAWVYCDPQISITGEAWGFERTAEHVLMMRDGSKSTTFQAIRSDGLIYDPKEAEKAASKV